VNNSIQFILYSPNITNYKFASGGFTICTHTTSLTFDLTSDQEKVPKHRRRKNIHADKKGRNLQERNRGGWAEE